MKRVRIVRMLPALLAVFALAGCGSLAGQQSAAVPSPEASLEESATTPQDGESVPEAPAQTSEAQEGILPKGSEMTFQSGTFTIFEIMDPSPLAPGDMAENQKSFAVRLLYDADGDTDILKNNSRLVTQDGEEYVASVSAVLASENLYTLIFAIPENTDTSTLLFRYEDQTIPLYD